MALSGGADSVALLHLLLELATEGDLAVVGAIHVNHRLRGRASDLDEVFCRRLAQECGVPIAVEAVDVIGARAAARGSLEAIASQLRYEALGRAASHLQASRVAVGHTRDDQAETVLLKLLRGAGATGLSGIHPRRGIFVRPLLGAGREALRAYLERSGWAWREDASNDDPSLARNRIRHELLPYLRSFAPHVTSRLAATAELSRDDAALLDELAEAQFAAVVTATDDGRLLLDRRRLTSLPRALSGRIVRKALGRVSRERWAGILDVDGVLQVAAGTCTAVDLPGVRVEPLGATVVLQRGSVGRDRRSTVEPFSYALPVPGMVSVLEAACRIDAEWQPACTAGDLEGTDASRVCVAVAGAPLVVRNWRKGDRFRPFGLRGRKKLHDLFIDRKVPRADRGRIPLVVDPSDRIVWVAGYAISDEFRVTDPSKPVVVLKLRQLSGGRF